MVNAVFSGFKPALGLEWRGQEGQDEIQQRDHRRGGRLPLAMYFATVVWPTSIPSLRSSPWIRGAPHSGLATLMSRTSRRISSGIFGRPPRGLDLKRQ